MMRFRCRVKDSGSAFYWIGVEWMQKIRNGKRTLQHGGLWMVLSLAFLCLAAVAVLSQTPSSPESEAQQDAMEEEHSAAVQAERPHVDPPQAVLDFVERYPEAADFAEGWPGTVVDAGEIDLSGDYAPGTIPLLLQFDSRWGYAYYGGSSVSDLLALSGCGPTALSMAVVGLTGDTGWNPLAVAEYAADHDYWTESDGTKWLLVSEGCRDMGLTAEEVPLDLGCMTAALGADSCIICVVGPGDFTDKGHFLVICGYDGTGFTIRDPASRANSETTWTYERLSPQIQGMWKLSKK